MVLSIRKISFALTPTVRNRPSVCTVDTPQGKMTLHAKAGDRYVLQTATRTYYGYLPGARPQSHEALVEMAFASHRIIEMANQQKPGWRKLEIHSGGRLLLDGAPLNPGGLQALEEMRRLAYVLGAGSLGRRRQS